MAITTARDLCTSSLITAGIIGATEAPESSEIADALNQLNGLIDSLNIDKLWPYTYTEFSGSLTSAVDVYSVGPSGGWVTPRPVEITALSVIDSNREIPLKEYSNRDWANAGKNEDVDGRPRFFRYLPNQLNGSIEVYPTPNQNYPIKLTYQYSLLEYGLNDNLDLPAGYKGYLEYGLATILGVRYGVNVDRISMIAEKRLKAIRTNNTETATMSLGNLPIGRSSQYNVRTDSYQ